MATWRVNNSTSLGGEVCSTWQSSHAYALGARCVCTWTYATTTVRRRVFECTTAGTSGGTEPTWDANVGNTTSDGTAVWTCRSPDDGTWNNASCHLSYISYPTAPAAGDVIYVHKDHAENISVVTTVNIYGSATDNNWVKTLCVDKDDSDSLAVGAVVQVSNSIVVINFYGFSYIYGVLFNTNSDIYLRSSVTHGALVLESDGSDVIELTGANKSFYVGYSTAAKPNTVKIINGGVNFALSSNCINIGLYGRFFWYGGTLTTTNGTAFLIRYSAYSPGLVHVKDVDLDDIGMDATQACLLDNGGSIQYEVLFERCKLPIDSGFVVCPPTSWISASGSKARFHHCSGGNSTLDFVESSFEGETEDEINIYRSDGAQHGTTNYSFKLASSADVQELINPLESPPIQTWTDTAGSVTFTIHGVWDSATNIQDDEIWMELDYPANNSDGLGALETTRVGLLSTPSDCPVSTETWNGTGAMSNENKFKLTATVTTGKAGPVTARICLAKASTTVYIDPVLIES